MKTAKLAPGLCLALIVSGLGLVAGCEKGPGEKMGAKIDRAVEGGPVEKAGRAVDRATK